MIIQRLGACDLTLMRQLNLMFGAAFGDTTSYAAATPSDDYLVHLLGQDHVFALVATQDNENVVGGLVAYELPKLEQARSEIYIYDLAVAETHRRRGIATGLINKLRNLAAGRGCWVIYVQAEYGDDPAIALYTKLGIREDVMHFDIPVSDSAKA